MNDMNKLEVMKQGVQQEAEKIVSNLQTLGDEIRLKPHLAGADGRDAWKQLEPQLQQFGQRAARATETAIGEIRSAGKELEGQLQRLCAQLRKS